MLPGRLILQLIRLKAFSLLEVLLASALASLLLAVLLLIFVPMWRSSQQLNRRSALNLTASYVLAELAQEAQQTQAAGLEWHQLPEKRVFSVHKIRDQQDTGAAVYEQRVTVFYFQDASLRRASFPPLPAGLSSLPGVQRPYHWTVEDLQLALRSKPGTLLAEHVDSFEVSGITPQGLSVPILVQLRLSFEGQTVNAIRSFFPLVTNAT